MYEFRVYYKGSCDTNISIFIYSCRRGKIMEKKLPMEEPIINTYPNYGYIFGIIGACTQDYLPWLNNYFVQLMVPANIEEGFRADYAISHLLKTIPWIEYGRIDRDMVINKWIKMSTFIKDMVYAGYYVYTLFDVSKFNAYGRKGFSLHDPLLYGYDDEKEVFFILNINNAMIMVIVILKILYS